MAEHATQAEIRKAREEQSYWRSVGDALQCSVFGWHDLNYCTFIEPDGYKFTLSSRTAARVIDLAKVDGT